jgi:hypothetical protein
MPKATVTQATITRAVKAVAHDVRREAIVSRWTLDFIGKNCVAD